ncbi:MAG: hypothetical protein ACLUOI_29090 [Eisenbergiella sp.]
MSTKNTSGVSGAQPWVDVSSRPEVISFYDYYDYLLTFLTEQERKWRERRDKEHNGVPALGLHMERLGDKGDTAYVRADSFDDSRIEEEVPEIRGFRRRRKTAEI